MKKILLSTITFIVLLAVFQNCDGGYYKSIGSDGFSVGNGDNKNPTVTEKTCEMILEEAYRNTFYKFVRDNRCYHCHVTGGLGKGTFAQEDLKGSMDAFMTVGAETLAIKAVSDHQSGYTGPHHKAAIETYKETWDSAVNSYNSCGEEEIVNVEKTYITSEKLIGLIDDQGNPVSEDEFKELTWELGDEEFGAGAEGATFSISIMYSERFKGIPVYVLTFPKLKTQGQTITILGINVLLNGKKLGRTTFDFKSVTLPPFSSIQLSNIGLDLQPEDGEVFLTPTDTIQVEFDYFIVQGI